MSSRRRHKTISATGSGVAWLGLWLIAAVVLPLSGCAAAEARRQADEAARVRAMVDYLEDKPRALQPHYRLVRTHGRRDRVLNQMQAGLAAFEYGRGDLARESFDEVLGGIETVFANSPQAAKARSLWRREGSKIFKGEPYERAMAYYYRGLLYLQDGDYENARACFKSGVLQDAIAEEQQNRCDFALLIFLDGWASQCLGQMQLAQASYDEVKALRPDFVAPAPDDNVLVLAETGRAPQKVAGGPGGAELRYCRGVGFTEQRVRFDLGMSTHGMFAIEDIYWQASTRGGRQVEKVLKGQVVFKERHKTLGQVLTTVGMGTIAAAPDSGHGRRDMQAIGGAIALVGLLNLAAANAVQSGADTRHWRNLPDSVHVRTLRLDPAAPVELSACFLDAAARPVEHLQAGASIRFPDGDPHGLAWFRSRSAL